MKSKTKIVLDGNIFELPDGNYAVSLINMPLSYSMEDCGFRKNIPVGVRLPDASEIKECRLLGVEYKGYHNASFNFTEPDKLIITVSFHRAASLILLIKKDLDMMGLKPATTNPLNQKLP